jgi:PAS domain S-box-containing protein
MLNYLSEAIYQRAVDEFNIVSITNQEGIIVYANDKFCQLSQYSREELVGNPHNIINSGYHPKAFWEMLWETIGKGQVWQGEIRNRAKDGSFYWVNTTIVPILDEEKRIEAFFSLRTDITLRKQAEQKLLSEQKRETALVQAFEDGFFSLDAQWCFTSVNHVFERIIRHNQDSVLGKTFWSLFPKLIGSPLQEEFLAAMESGQERRFETYYPLTGQWFYVNIHPHDKELLVYFRDVSERKQYEQQINKLSLVAQHTTNVVIITDAEGHIEWVNQAFSQISGYSLSEVVGKKPGDFLQGADTNPETVAYMRLQMRQQEPFECEIINYSKRGQPYWISIQVQPIFSDQGELIQFFAIQTEITEKKHREAELIESENKLRAFFESTTDANFLLDLQYRIITFNRTGADAIRRIYGIQVRIGDSMLDYSALHTKEDFKANFQRAIEGQRQKVERQITYRPGESCWWSVTYQPIYDRYEQVLGVAFNAANIEERKRAEEKIVAQNNRLLELARLNSHDIRRPVANILGIISLLDPSRMSKENQELLALLEESAQQMDAIIHQINDKIYEIEP